MPAKQIELRRATSADVARIEALVSLAYGKYVARIGRKPKPMLADYHVALAEHQLWVGELGGNVVAVLELLPLPTHLLIENIAVQPERQGSGVGRLLLAFAEQEATRQGYAEVRLYTNAKFTENLAIYSKLGYRELRREVTPAAEIVHMSKLVTRAA